MNKLEIEKALKNGTLVWNDPDPIEGADYTVQLVTYYGREDDENRPEEEMDTVLIHYGEHCEDGIYSEAEVYKTELKIK